METTENQPLIKCPKCKSTQITPKQKGFGLGKAAAGAILTGGVGLLAGFWGSKDIEVVCLNCGKTWNPKKSTQDIYNENQQKQNINTRIIHYYEKGDKELALKIHNENFPPLTDIEIVYANAKTQSEQYHNAGMWTVFIMIFLFVIILIMCSK